MFFKIDVIPKIDLSGVIRTAKWQDYFNFKVVEVPRSVIASDAFLERLYRVHPFRAGVTRMEPYTVYDWHVDDVRKVSINMLWEAGEYVTAFSLGGDMVKKIMPVTYQLHRYYFFDTQLPHMVMNFDKPRYMFTVEFAPDFTANDLLEYLNDPATKRSLSGD